MYGRRWLGAGLVAVAIAMATAFPAVASAAYTNPDCTGCHASTLGAVPAQDFNVGDVDFDTACKKCHDDSLVGSHPYHNPTSNCGATCHPEMGPALVTAVPTNLDPRGYGAFASATSADTDPALLHLIHSKPRWMESMQYPSSTCGSCHAVATCDSCHDNPPAPDTTTHANHASSMSLTPWVGNTSSGVTAGDQTENTYVVGNSSRCGAVGCHDTAGVASSAPGLQDDKSHGADAARGYLVNTVVKTGTWKVMLANIYTMGQTSQSNVASSTLSITFTGEQVVLLADKDPYRGIAEIKIDGVSQGTVDMYQDTTKTQVVVFKSAVLPTSGPHTITVRATGTKNAAARAAYIRVDQFQVYNRVPGKVAPDCVSCHPANADPHGLGSFSHEATGTADNTWAAAGTSTCDSCHGMSFLSEHNRMSSSSAGVGCANCHTTYAPTTWTGTWDTNNGCAYTTCHAAATPREPHTSAAMTTGHAVTTDPAEAACRGCHTGDLGAIHSNSITTNSFVTNCNTCHTPTKYPSTKSCVDAACHEASGVTAVDDHYFDPTKHTATPWTSVYQGSAPSVSTGGKECSVCHSARLDTAHATTSVGAVGCTSGGTGNTGCHNDTSLTSQAVASADWSQKRCTQCHNSGANVSHDSTVTPHAVPAGTCAGTASGCHTSTDLWALHANSYSGGAPTGDSCANTGCHSAGNLDKRPSLKTCGTGNACHTDKDTGTHPGAKDHTYTAASDYSAATETGCANSGAGCHGADATRVDMAVPYHPATGCLGGACHTSASKPGYGGSNECVTCHDNNYAGAPDRVALTSAYPGGHYSETTHTAGGASATVAAGGSASATCSNCHNGASAGIDGLYAQHQGLAASQVTAATFSNVACGECHSYSAAMSAVVNGTWDKSCASCHTVSVLPTAVQHGATAPVVNTTSTSSCGATGVNCHTTYDVHALHKNAAGGCNITGCHDYTKQGAKPTLTACGQAGGCHATYTSNTHAHTADAAKHQPTTTTQASATTFASTACGACHDIRNSNSSLTLEHALATSAKTTSAGNNCLNCHNNALATTTIAGNWATKDTTTACSTCHTAALAIHADANSTAHGDVASAGCSSSGIGCHNTGDLSQVGATNVVNTNIHSSCLRCHDRTATAPNLAYNPANDTCGSGRECHAVAGLYNTTTFVHNGSTGAGLANGNDIDHHTDSVMTGTMTQGVATATCATCHTGTLATAHATSAIANTCAGCHNSTLAGNVSANQVKAGWTANDCGDCHVAGASAVKIPNMHSGYGAAAHNGTSTQSCGASGAGCHTTYDLAALHGKTKTNGCALAGCHDSVDKNMSTAAKSCGSGGTCHSTYTPTAGHYASTTTGDEPTHTATGMASTIDTATYSWGNACSNCHSSGLKSAHTTVTAVLDSARTAWTTPYCTNCHNSSFTEANSVTTIKTDSWSAKTCDQCHVTNGNGKHTTYTLGKHTATLNGGCAASNVGCHNTADVRTIHNKVTAGCTASGPDSKLGTASGCHDLNKAMPTAQISCGLGGCHSNHTNINHGAAHTLDEPTSAYNNTTTAGCTGAGAGCHGATNASYAVTQFHPTAGVTCTSSKCHDASATNHNNAAFDDPNSCQDCHGGGTVDYVNAPLVSNLTATTGAAQGHYNETTHTATGMNTAINAGGTISATCNDCHKADPVTGLKQLYTQHQLINSVVNPSVVTTTFTDGFESGSFGAWTTADYQAYVPAETSVFADTFETYNTGAFVAPWTSSNAVNVIVNTPVYAGTRAGQLNRASGSATARDVFRGPYNTSAGGAKVKMYFRTSGMQTSKFSVFDSTNGTTWTERGIVIQNANAAAMTYAEVPVTTSGTLYVQLRLTPTNDANTKQVTFDNVELVTAGVGTPEAGWSVRTDSARTATYGARAIGADATTRTVTKTGINNTGADSVSLNYSISYASLEAADSLVVETYNGSTWSTAKSYTLTGAGLAWTDEAITGLPATTSGVRFAFKGSTADDLVYVDDVVMKKVVNGSVTGGLSVTCADCHSKNAKTISLVTQATAWNGSCAACHDGTDGITAQSHASSVPAVTGTSTQGCAGSGAGCHVTDLHAIHKGKSGSTVTCASCHTYAGQAIMPTKKSCGSGNDCHTGATYVSNNHGKTGDDDPLHTAVSMATKVDGTTYDNGGGNLCSSCHSAGLKTAHTTKAGWTTPYCLNCHNSAAPVNSVKVVKTDSWSTKLCDECHVTNGPGKHSTYTTASHTATDGANTCTLCHSSSDVRVIHNKYSAGCTASGTDGLGFANPGCHAPNKDMATTPMACGSGTGGCHQNHTNSNHTSHPADLAENVRFGSQVDQTYQLGTNVGCFMSTANTGCHFQDLTMEHGSTTYLTTTKGIAGAVQRTMNGSRGTNADGCTVCHTTAALGTAGAYASRTAVAAAITIGDRRCTGCHFETSDAAGTTGVQAPHKTNEKVATAPLGTTAEWAAAGAQGGGHNSFAVSFPKVGLNAYGTSINGVTMNSTWPAYTKPFVGTDPKTGGAWTATSRVLCVDCHDRTTAPAGPQGATVPWYVNNGPAVTGQITTHWYTSTSGAAPAPCNKCHGALSSFHSNRGAHQVACQNCHIKIPHAWKRPRLLRRIVGGTVAGIPQDPEPYALQNGSGNVGFTVTGNQTNFSDGGSCVTNCGEHSNSTTNLWP